MRKFLFLVAALASVGYVGYRYFTAKAVVRGGRAGGARVVAVETSRIQKADLGDRLVFTGSIRAEERYDATPRISGILRQVNFNVGDIVQRGDILAVLDDDEYVLAVEQAEASLLVAKANANDAEKQLEIARRDYRRAENLRNERVISVQEFDQVDAAFQGQAAKFETALAEVSLAEAALKTAKVKLGYTRVKAEWTAGPIQRVIGQRYMDAGAIVTTTTPILSVLDIHSVRAVIPVNEKDYPKIILGGSVTVTTDAFPGLTFPGRVARIPQELGVMTREAEVEIAVGNPGLRLKPGMFIRADIEFARRDGATAAPLEAVVRRDDGSRGVFLVNDDRTQVTFQPVTEGIVDGRLVELVDANGLLDREVVVLGQHLLKDGISVRVAGNSAVDA